MTYREAFTLADEALRLLESLGRIFENGTAREAALAAAGKPPSEASNVLAEVMETRELTRGLFRDGAGI